MKTSSILLIPFLFILFSCTSSNPEAKSTRESDIQEDRKSDTIIEYCYRMEQPFENEEGKVEQLEMRLVFNADEVTGHYNWLPVYKDQRQGTIVGKLHDSIILAKYYFEQEGFRDTAEVNILLKKNGIIVSSKRKELGLDTTLPLVDCLETDDKN
jgi:hypothetical protein